MKGRIISILLLMSTALSCGVRRHAVLSHEATIDFDKEQTATFYYTEALKKSLIHDSVDAALDLLHRAIITDLGHAPSYYEAAVLLLSEGLVEAAVPYGVAAYELDSLNPWYKNLRGRLYIETGEYYQALKIFRDLAARDPYNPEMYHLLAALYMQEKMPLAAISVLDSAEYKIGRVEELSQMKRELLIKTGQIDRAIEQTEAHLADFPYDEQAYLVLADMYGFNKRDSLRLATLKRLLAENPRSADGLLSLSEYYQERGDGNAFLQTVDRIMALDEFPVESKVEIFRTITSDREFYRSNYHSVNSIILGLVARHPDNYEVIDAYAGHLIASSEIEHALLIYKSQIEKPNPPAEAFDAVIEIETYLQRPDSVAEYTLRALEIYGDNPRAKADILLRRAAALQYMERWDEALKTFKQGLRQAPTDSLKSVFECSIGDLHYMRGASGKAFSHYEKALSYDADNILALNNYAYFLSEVGMQLEKALEMSVRSNALSKSNPTYLDTQAWILYKLGRYAEAKPVMQQALSLDRSASPVLLLHYGDILDALGDRFMATMYWKRAKEAGYDAAEIDKRLDKR